MANVQDIASHNQPLCKTFKETMIILVCYYFRYDVIVVGAGIAGIAAAEMLQEYNYSYVILEARNRIGGRIHTYEFGIFLIYHTDNYIMI